MTWGQTSGKLKGFSYPAIEHDDAKCTINHNVVCVCIFFLPDRKGTVEADDKSHDRRSWRTCTQGCECNEHKSTIHATYMPFLRDIYEIVYVLWN